MEKRIALFGPLLTLLTLLCALPSAAQQSSPVQETAAEQTGPSAQLPAATPTEDAIKRYSIVQTLTPQQARTDSASSNAAGTASTPALPANSGAAGTASTTALPVNSGRAAGAGVSTEPGRVAPRPLMPAGPQGMEGMQGTQFRPEVGDKVKVYAGPDGLRVLVMRYGPIRVSEALVQFSGIEHAWNMKIQKLEVRKIGDERQYWLNLKGKRFVAMTIRDNTLGEVTLPDETDARQVSYDSALSSEINPNYFLADYLSTK